MRVDFDSMVAATRPASAVISLAQLTSAPPSLRFNSVSECWPIVAPRYRPYACSPYPRSPHSGKSFARASTSAARAGSSSAASAAVSKSFRNLSITSAFLASRCSIGDIPASSTAAVCSFSASGSNVRYLWMALAAAARSFSFSASSTPSTQLRNPSTSLTEAIVSCNRTLIVSSSRTLEDTFSAMWQVEPTVTARPSAFACSFASLGAVRWRAPSLT
mmetsp:Transcript_6103/g.15596  ORF Transcript_6103/g.15596 Transcript_6103/m.15596 type:complete len:218 (+) Transcript_6103:1567-2220(+)